MTFLNFYIGFSVLTFIMLLMQSYVVSKRLKRKYPDITSEFYKNNKEDILEKIFSYIKIFVSCFVPIINIGIFYASIFESETVEKRMLDKMQNSIKEDFKR